MSEWANNEELEIFREYLRIPSVHPNIDYGKNSHWKNTMSSSANAENYELFM